MGNGSWGVRAWKGSGDVSKTYTNAQMGREILEQEVAARERRGSM